MRFFISVFAFLAAVSLFSNIPNIFAQDSCPRTLEEVKKDKRFKRIKPKEYKSLQSGDSYLICDYGASNLLSETPYVNNQIEGLVKEYPKEYSLHFPSQYIATPFIAGKKEGVQKAYRLSGELTAETTFIDDKENGICKFYYKSGKVAGEGTYVSGEPEGNAKLYYENGKLKAEETYIAGKKEKIATYYYENGNLQAEIPYVKNQIEGTMKKYYENGTLYSETPFFADKLEGVEKIYRKDGILAYETQFTENQLEGITKIYNENGKIYAEIQFIAGKPKGVEKLYRQDGTILQSKADSSRIYGEGTYYNQDGTTRPLTDEELLKLRNFIRASEYLREIQDDYYDNRVKKTVTDADGPKLFNLDMHPQCVITQP
ncbi:toxin-antitoxin system YwqK family antitoxin [Desulfovibrio litoralis]|uniref:Antitoxin component YwqK of the YwqJK toxin-antitoxin module n=1 Tax=Desulfovibrio litoralis DSM 11393 TaxID=1121455 RepID=A0A1M7SB67_9BACT|nr:toxin-antitoxin system YwqK family antitoxin [Desulfovibrio litoralis]SHN55749.1 Antitoxin component YwqK of the YwqJK toxin-antitoxin module [Desulfovibrio litoralis DSM 11393]